MPKTLIKRLNLHTSKIREQPKIVDNKDKLKEFKEKLLSGSGFLKIY